MLKYTIMLLTLIALVVLAYFYYLGKVSQSQAIQPISSDKLSPCPDTPNCVCSEYSDDSEHFISAVELNALEFDQLVAAVKAMGGEIKIQQGNYLAAESKSGIFGFVDDFELRLDHENQKLHLRSASRVGYSDLGANRKRVEKFKQMLGTG